MGAAVRAHSRLRIDRAGRVAEMTEQPPVAWRRTPEAMYLVGTAGGLTGDDAVHLDVEVAATAALVVRSAAASVAYTGQGTVQRTDVLVGADAFVDWCPQPLIVTAGACHRQTATIRADPTATVDWTEIVVLGRHGEGPGRAGLGLDCVLTDPVGVDRPLLRHRLAVGPGTPGWDGPAVLGSNRTVGLRLLAGPDLTAPPRRSGEGWAWMDLDGPGWMLTAVGPDLPTLARRMEEAGNRPPAR